MSNTEWGYKFTVTAGHLGRFQTGVCPGLSVCRMSLPGTLGGGVGAIMSRIFVTVKAGTLILAHGHRGVLWWLAVLLHGRVEEHLWAPRKDPSSLGICRVVCEREELKMLVLCCFYERQNLTIVTSSYLLNIRVNNTRLNTRANH